MENLLKCISDVDTSDVRDVSEPSNTYLNLGDVDTGITTKSKDDPHFFTFLFSRSKMDYCKLLGDNYVAYLIALTSNIPTFQGAMSSL